jgi:hypothetical protein
MAQDEPMIESCAGLGGVGRRPGGLSASISWLTSLEAAMAHHGLYGRIFTA